MKSNSITKRLVSASIVAGGLVFGTLQADSILDSKLALWTGENTQLRGINLNAPPRPHSSPPPNGDGQNQQSDDPTRDKEAKPAPLSEEFIQAVSDMGANLVYVSLPVPSPQNEETTQAGAKNETEAEENAPQLIDLLEKSDLFAVVSLQSPPPQSHEAPPNEEQDSAWKDDAPQVPDSPQMDLPTAWRTLAESLKEKEFVAAFHVAVPAQKNEKRPDGDQPPPEPQENEGDQPPSPERQAEEQQEPFDSLTLHASIIEAIREVDTSTPIIIDAKLLENVEELPEQFSQGVVFTFGPPKRQNSNQNDDGAPGGEKPDDAMPDAPPLEDKEGDMSLADKIDEFLSHHSVPLTISEFGINAQEETPIESLTTQLVDFEEHKLNHAIQIPLALFSPDSVGGEEKDETNQERPIDDDTRMKILSILQENWALNTLRPSNVEFNDSTDDDEAIDDGTDDADDMEDDENIDVNDEESIDDDSSQPTADVDDTESSVGAQLTDGSILIIKATDIGLNEISGKVKIDAKFDSHKTTLKILGDKKIDEPVTEIACVLQGRISLFDKREYKNIELGEALENQPIKARAFDSIEVKCDEGELKLDRTIEVVPPVVDSVEASDGSYIVKGRFFGVNPPKVLMEYHPNGDFEKTRYKSCEIDRKASARFENAMGRPSCMRVGDADGGYSEITIKLPGLKETDEPTGYLVLDNKIGMVSFMID